MNSQHVCCLNKTLLAGHWNASREKRRQTFHASSEHEQKPRHLSKGTPGTSTVPVPHREVGFDRDVIYTTVPESFVGLPEEAMNALATSRKSAYLFCSLQNFDFRSLVQEQKYEHGEELAMSVEYVLADPQYKISYT